MKRAFFFFLLFCKMGLEAAPAVTQVSPVNGPIAGGTVVTITGSGFTGATNVLFGTTSAASFLVLNDNTITATSPVSVIGDVDITVINGVASPIVRQDIFTYQGNWVLYVTDSLANALYPVQIPANTVGAPIPLGAGGAPMAVAVTPYAQFAVAANTGNDTVVVVNLATTTTASVSLPGGSAPVNVAITPNGQAAYVVNSGTNDVAVILIGVPALVTTILIGLLPLGIAISPDGTRAYVAIGSDGSISVIDTSSNTVIANVGGLGFPQEVSITPDGLFVYIADGNNNNVRILDTTTNTLTATVIPVGINPLDIDITPDGTRVYVTNEGGTVSVIDIATNTVTATIPGFSFPIELSIAPDGKRAYVTDQVADNVKVIDTTTNTITSTISGFAAPAGDAITPDQAPVARFTTTGTNPVTFDASGSISPVGSVLSYFWDFGDSTTATTASSSINHNYSAPGTYTVTLTVTNSAGTSTSQVFTGQTMSRNGNNFATVSQSVTAGGGGPVTIPAPKHFLGKVERIHGKLRLHSWWSKVTNATEYQIFKQDKKIKTISASHSKKFHKTLHPKRFFFTHHRAYKKFLDRRYKIRAVDSAGNVSSFRRLHVK